MALRVRGFALPEGEPVDLYADGDRWTTDPVRGAEQVAEGCCCPVSSTRTPTPAQSRPGGHWTRNSCGNS